MQASFGYAIFRSLSPFRLMIISTSDLLTEPADGSVCEVQRHCDSFHQSFLLEANGKLLAVFLGFMGKWLRLFELDFSDMLWVEVDNVGDETLDISRISSLATTATREDTKTAWYVILLAQESGIAMVQMLL
ncbi:hypothetical protein V6N11_038713 [Hibiscus sabdariffa]|uniref:Uncharacterized protein n=1 Tax=Hibiscus sabdariffa TaxID=183260 RepID=A0ABR2SKU9_9ROSI